MGEVARLRRELEGTQGNEKELEELRAEIYTLKQQKTELEHHCNQLEINYNTFKDILKKKEL